MLSYNLFNSINNLLAYVSIYSFKWWTTNFVSKSETEDILPFIDQSLKRNSSLSG